MTGAISTGADDYDINVGKCPISTSIKQAFKFAKIWLGGDQRIYPHISLPISMARKYQMDRKCMVRVIDHNDGLLIKFEYEELEDEEEKEKDKKGVYGY